MILWKTIIFIFLLSFVDLTFGQTSCDTLSPDIIKQFDSYSQKEFNKLKNNKKLDLKTAFDIATYCRLKNDTTYKQWYLLYIELTKQMYASCKIDKGSPTSPLFYAGVAYYYNDNFVQAESWFIKAIKASYTGNCLDYYYTKTREKLGKPNK